MAPIAANRRQSPADLRTFAGVPPHEVVAPLRSVRRRSSHRGPDRLPAAERKALLDALRTSATRTDACAMAGIPPKTLEGWLYVAQGKNSQRPATPWHKALLRDVLKAEASPVVLLEGNVVAASKTHPGPAVRYALARWPEKFAPDAGPAPVATSYVQQKVIIIPPERIAEFARFLARADFPEITDSSGRIIDPLASLVHIEE